MPVSSGVEAAGRCRSGSPERVGWGWGWVPPTIRRQTRRRRVRCSLAVIAACPPPPPSMEPSTGGVAGFPAQVALTASRHQGAVVVLYVARTREVAAGEATEKRPAVGREVEKDLGAWALSLSSSGEEA